ncbi:MAG TPA: GAF domain-containing protein, partial [Chloroflexota bacterium]|nr:GAF domain-containing protein [Chloroflexota bacterium]
MLERLVRAIVPAFADWCVVDVVEPDFQQCVAVAHVDATKEPLAREIQRRFQPISSATSPMRQVLDSGQPRYLADYTSDAAQVDGLDGDNLALVRQLGPKSVISVPLTGRRGRLGVMSFLQSDSDRRFKTDDLALAEEVANRAALAIENAQLYRDTERSATQLRQAEERQRFLVEASKLLDSSLDYQLTLDRLAHLFVPALADWCTVDILREGRLGESISIAAADPAKADLAREFQQRWPPSMEDPRGAAKVIRTGEPELVPDITDDMLVASAYDPEHLRVMRALGPWSSGMALPLKARGKTVGVMTVITAESGRRYGPDDLVFALEVANRAALAVDNARLYAAEHQARRQAERLQALTQQLGQSLAVETVLQHIADTAAELLESPVAGVFLLDPSGERFDLAAGRGLELASNIQLPRSRSLAGQVIASGKPATVDDARTAPVTALPQLLSGQAVGSLVVAPIISSSGPLGVVEVYATSVGAFEQQHAELLSALAGTASAVLENARLYGERELDLGRLRTIMEQLPVAVIVVEAPSGEITLKNRQADTLFG